LIRQLSELAPEDVSGREQEAQRLLRDNGVTYNVYDDPTQLARPWLLDLIPHVLDPADWNVIERGVEQRAVLLDRLLDDIYGPRRLIAGGLVPHALVFTHPGFSRPCAGIVQAGPARLPLYAADLARGPDGRFFVLSDRAQAPSGMGYALENRLVLSRVLPRPFRRLHVRRLAGFFRRMRSAVAAAAPRGQEDPVTALLTPGPRSETYFEHAYLAAYLGYTLVEGADLSVRDGAVRLLTIDGLRRVDVILRRVDDAFCDPLELREDSFLGVPGLLEAVRNRRVGVVNPLGSAVLENPGLMAILPRLCEELLGEDLLLPSVPTWWCGRPADCSHVLAHLDRMVIKPIHRAVGQRPIFGDRLSSSERDELKAAIRARPEQYVGQQPLDLSSLPVLQGEVLEPRRAVLRCFMAADGEGRTVMPGGLTRVSASLDEPLVSSHTGGMSKDTWVLGEQFEKWQSLIPQIGSLAATRAAEACGLPSRVADSLYWLGRYVERVEGTARMLRVVFQRLSDLDGDAGMDDDLSFGALLRALTMQTDTWPGFVGEGSEDRLSFPGPELVSVLGATEPSGTLAASLQWLLNTARAVRDQLSVDTWRLVDDLEASLRVLRASTATGAMARGIRELERLVNSLLAFAGLIRENLIHSPGWRFLEIGRRIERALHTAQLLRSMLVTPLEGRDEVQGVESVLRILDSLITYRRRYRATSDVACVLDLVLLDESNPRSVAYQLASLDDHLEKLPRRGQPRYASVAERELLEALTALRLADPLVLAAPSPTDVGPAERWELDLLLADVLGRLPEVSDALTATFFRHAELPTPLNPTGR